MNQVFKYNDSEICFQTGNGSVMVNATEMAKPFGKNPWKWLELPSTKEFLSALSENRSLAEHELVTSVRGGNDPSTRGNWFHEDLALEFARWLSPVFAIWCNDRIKEILRHGATAINPEDLLNPDFIINLATALKNEREEKRLIENENIALAEENKLHQVELKAAAPKLQYYNNVLQSQNLIVTTVIAKELGMSAESLNKILFKLGIHYKAGDTWVLYAKYQDKGYTGTKTHFFSDSFGNEKTSIHTYWTEKGRQFVHGVVKQYMTRSTEPSIQFSNDSK